MSGKIGRIPDRHVAFWHISSFLAAHPAYRELSFSKMRMVQQAIAHGDYCCLSDGKTIQAVATWCRINAEEILRAYPDHVPKTTVPIDGVFLSSLAAIDRASLKIMIRHLRTGFATKDIYWYRHQGKLGHRAGKPPA
jgi:hypothetical protein